MAEQHPAEDLLLDLALGDVSEPGQDELVQHLASCSDCRRTYDRVAKTIDDTLAAAPRVQPRPGFDQTVLKALGVEPEASESHATRARARNRHRPAPNRLRLWQRRPAALIAAGVVGVLLGVGGAVITGVVNDDPPATTAASGAQLTTSDGDVVGMTSLSYVDGRRVLVVTAAGGHEGVRYECRVRLPDGSTETVGEWPVPDEGATWVMPIPDTPVTGVELVAESGIVWSTATL